MAGRRPKPLAMHRLNGNPSMLNAAELSGVENPQPELGIPEMPKGMMPAARREWKAICKLLLTNGLLTLVDGKALMAYCNAYARAEEAQKIIDKYSPVIQTSFLDKEGNLVIGDLKANPAVAQAKMWLSLMKSFLIEFGLTPASRRNLKAVRKAPGDPMEDFMNSNRSSGPPIPIPMRPEDEPDSL